MSHAPALRPHAMHVAQRVRCYRVREGFAGLEEAGSSLKLEPLSEGAWGSSGAC